MLIVFMFAIIGVLGPVIYNKRRFQLPESLPEVKDLPTVSLLIPARNETHAITKALDNALLINYPKLEIIVIDDESSDDTSEKIRSFAQRGVRFIAGKPLPLGWVGKTFACHQLSQAASGEYLVFCDVDVFLGPKALPSLIKLMESRRLGCVSVHPKFLALNLRNVLVEPLQTLLFHLLPIKRLGLVRVFGGLLIFKQSSYSQSGGYGLRSEKILPEIFLSSYFQERASYQFLTAGKRLQAISIKKPDSLNESRMRYYYPLFAESPGAVSLLALLVLLVPLALLIMPSPYGWLLAGVLVLAQGISCMGLRRNPVLSALALPINFFWEVFMFFSSLWRYRYSKVSWKGRTISKNAAA